MSGSDCPSSQSDLSSSDDGSSDDGVASGYGNLFGDPELNELAYGFTTEACTGKMPKEKCKRLWRLFTRFSRLDTSQLGSYKSMLNKVLKLTPTITQKWKVKDLATNNLIIGSGKIYPKKKYSNKKLYSLQEMWTYVKLKDIIKFHVSLHRKSKHKFLRNGKIDYSKIVLDLTCDGIQYSNSSTDSLYLSCVRFVGCRNIYVLNSRLAKNGVKKEIKDFLHDFVQDANELGVQVRKFLGDTPVRSLFKRLKGHNGHNSCEICKARGVLIGKHVYYPASEMDGELRTKHGWRKDAKQRHNTGADNVNGVTGTSPLLKLKGFNIITDSPSDALHRDYLGIMKATWILCTNQKKTCNIRFANAKKFAKYVSEKYSKVRLPSEFSHRSRDVEVPAFKGHEWKSLIHSAFPALVKAATKFQSKKVGRIWALFAFLLRVYALPRDMYRSLDKTWLSGLRKEFYKTYEDVFGKLNCASNIHSFFHMDVLRKAGRMHTTSTEPFESFYAKILDSYQAGTLGVAKQYIEKCYIRHLRHTEQHCQRKLYFDIMKKNKRVDDSLLIDKDFRFYKVLGKTEQFITVKEIITKEWCCPGNMDLPFHVVGVREFLRLEDHEMNLPRDHFTGKAALYNKCVLMGMQIDILYA